MGAETITFPAWWLSLGVLIAAVAAASALVILIARKLRDREKKTWLEDLVDGAKMPRASIPIVLWMIGPLFLLAYLGASAMLLSSFGGWLEWFGGEVSPTAGPVPAGMVPSGTGSGSTSLGVGTLLVAILGAPFLIWRTMVAQRNANQTDETLFNQKVSAAASDLAARRKVTRRVRVVHYRIGKKEYETLETDDTPATLPKGARRLASGKQEVLTEEEDDIVTRSAAIDRLFGLVQERPAEAERIARLLSLYVRELSREYPAKESPRVIWMRAKYPKGAEERHDKEVFALTGLQPDDAGIDNVRDWVDSLEPCRSDLERAVQVLGQLATVDGVGLPDGCIDLRGATLQAFDLKALDFRKAQFDAAHLEGALLDWAHLEGATLGEAHLQGVSLDGAHLEGALLDGAHLVEASFGEAHLEGASLDGAHLQGAWLGGAHLDGAYLDGAHLQGVRFLGAAALRGSALRNLDCSDIPDISPHVADCFGDGSVILPGGVTPDHADWPAHWPKEKLKDKDFLTQWAAFKASLSPPVP